MRKRPAELSFGSEERRISTFLRFVKDAALFQSGPKSYVILSLSARFNAPSLVPFRLRNSAQRVFAPLSWVDETDSLKKKVGANSRR